MNIKTFFTIHAIISLLFGLGMLLLLATVLSYYGVVADEVAQEMSRFVGSALLTYAAVLWLARESGDSPARRAIVLGFFLTMIVGVVVALHTQLTTTTNALGWTTVALYAVLALCYGYFQFSGSKA